MNLKRWARLLLDFACVGSLWKAGLHHTLWNLAIVVTEIPLSGLEDWRAAAPLASRYHGPGWLTGGAFGPENSLITVVVVCSALALSIRHWRRQQGAATGDRALL